MTENDGRDDAEPLLKKSDAWWTVLVIDPIAMAVVRVVKPWSAVTPARLTVAAHLLGLVSAALIAVDQLVIAAIVFEVRFVLDCADGKLARLREQTSDAGAYLDFIGDYLVIGLCTATLSLHLQWYGDVEPALTVWIPVAFLAHIAAWQARYQEAERSGIRRRATAERSLTGYRRWMAERRLRTLPSRIEAEHALLFGAPLVAGITGSTAVLTTVSAVVTVYFIYRTLRLTAAGFLIARERDARAGSNR